MADEEDWGCGLTDDEDGWFGDLPDDADDYEVEKFDSDEDEGCGDACKI